MVWAATGLIIWLDILWLKWHIKKYLLMTIYIWSNLISGSHTVNSNHGCLLYFIVKAAVLLIRAILWLIWQRALFLMTLYRGISRLFYNCNSILYIIIITVALIQLTDECIFRTKLAAFYDTLMYFKDSIIIVI